MPTTGAAGNVPGEKWPTCSDAAPKPYTLAPAVVIQYPAVADGASGVTAGEAAEGGELPIALWATTLNVYAWPSVRPVTTVPGVGGDPITVVPAH